MWNGRNNCCGKIKWGRCHRGGGPRHITVRKPNGAAKRTKPYDICTVDWCRSDRKGRSHMKSTKAWTTVRQFFMKAKHGLNKRMIRLSADWALLSRTGTRNAVGLFAENQTAFFSTFSTAWEKVIGMSSNSLQ